MSMRNPNKGFTLLEILIALFVFTIVAMMTTAGLHSVTTSQAATEKRAERLSELQIAFTIISRDFEQTLNRPIINTQSEPAVFGLPKTIAFTHGGLTNPFGQLPRSTLQRTEYFLSADNLIRRSWPVLDHAMKITPDQRILITHVSHLSFEYLDNKNKFRDTWPPPSQTQGLLPRAVRIVLTVNEFGVMSQLYVIPAENPENNTDKKTEEESSVQKEAQH